MFISKSAKTHAAFIAISALILIAGCASPARLPGHEVKFIVIGNTSPASPFSGYPEKLQFVYKSINSENLVLVIHTGNSVHGGNEWMGITRKDLVRQYRDVIAEKKALSAIIHILPGEMDQYNGSLELFEHYIGKKLYYSFNYADSHFIMLSVLNKDHKLSPEQLKWLRDDLEIYKKSSAIFIFSHFPIMSPPQSGPAYRDGEELHRLFLRYAVKAVISGNMKKFSEYEKDGIRYINAGCFGFNNEDWHFGFNQYYLAYYDGINFTIKGIKVNFPANSYRPKIIKEESTEKKIKN